MSSDQTKSSDPPAPPEVSGLDTVENVGADTAANQAKSAPTMAEVRLGKGVPRQDPPDKPTASGDLYIRLEGHIYGPFQPSKLEELLQSGKLTGLESASPDLHRWTPLAYHPRIVRSRIRDFQKAHQALTDLSALPAPKRHAIIADLGAPLAAILRRPTAGRAQPQTSAASTLPSRGAASKKLGE
jgi:hypothetical protein